MAMANLYFDSDYEEQLWLKDDVEVWLRLIQPSDKAELQKGFNGLSEKSRYLRFISPKIRLNQRELNYLTEVDGWHHLAIVAGLRFPDGSEKGLGVGRFIRDPSNSEVAEAAVVVVDEMQGKGLGSLLLHRVSAAAMERGVKHFAVEFVSKNTSVAKLLEHLSPHISYTHEGATTRAVVDLVVDVEKIKESTRLQQQAHQIDSPLHRIMAKVASGLLSLRHHDE